MDHAEAVRLQAAEKYVLGDLSEELRDAYEEHYFDCPECARDVKAAAMFVEGVRQIAREEGAGAAVGHQTAPIGWLTRLQAGWLRPIIVAPMFAGLLAVAVYQNTITIPELKSGAMRSAGMQQQTQGSDASTIQLADSQRRGAGVTFVQVDPGQKGDVAFSFDFLPERQFSTYSCELRDPSGRLLVQMGVPADKAMQELRLVVPAGLLRAAGSYQVVLLGADETTLQPNRDSEVQRLAFTVGAK
jgi:hypothetical protein